VTTPPPLTPRPPGSSQGRTQPCATSATASTCRGTCRSWPPEVRPSQPESRPRPPAPRAEIVGHSDCAGTLPWHMQRAERRPHVTMWAAVSRERRSHPRRRPAAASAHGCSRALSCRAAAAAAAAWLQSCGVRWRRRPPPWVPSRGPRSRRSTGATRTHACSAELLAICPARQPWPRRRSSSQR
jgi:hypothetical protein